MLQGNLNALAKVAQLNNLLWRTAACPCCRLWVTDEYKSAGSFHPAISVLTRRMRDRMLEENAAGMANAKGKRDPSVTGA